MTEIVLVVAIAAIALASAAILARWVVAREWGTTRLRQAADALEPETVAVWGRHRKTVGLVVLAVAGVLFAIYGFVRAHESFDPTRGTIELATWATAAFVGGAATALAVGYAQTWVALRADVRAAAALAKSVPDAVEVAFRSAGVMGIVAVAAPLLGVATFVAAFVLAKGTELAGAVEIAPKIPLAIVAFAFGGSLVAFFAQVGPDLDARARSIVVPGTDVFETTAAETIGVLVVAAGVCFANAGRLAPGSGAVGLMLFPLCVRALGVVGAVFGTLSVKMDAREDPRLALMRGIYVASLLALLGAGGAAYWLLGAHWLPFFVCVGIGVGSSVAMTRFGFSAPAGEGVAAVLDRLWQPSVLIVISTLVCFELGEHSGLVRAGPLGVVAFVSGALTNAPYVLALQAMSPMASRAVALLEVGGAARDLPVDAFLTTAATSRRLGGGVVTLTGGLSAFVLLIAYVVEVDGYRCSAWGEQNGLPARAFGALLAQCRASLTTLDSAPLDASALFVGALAGTMMTLGFLAVSMRERHDAARDGDRRTVLHAVIVSATPVGVGILFKYAASAGAEAVATLLATTTVLGMLLALFFARQDDDASLPPRTFPAYLPTKSIIAFALVIAPLFI